jgi:protease-4
MGYRREGMARGFWDAFLGALAALVVFVIVIVTVVFWKTHEKTEVKDHSFLVVDIYGPLPEYDPPGGVLAEITGGKGETLQRVLTNLEKAAVDDAIEGVILKVSATNGAGRAKVEEIRGAVHKVRAAGKKVYGFSDSLDRDAFLLAAACDSIFVPPTAYVEFTGLAAVSEHVRGTLDKLGIRPNLHQIKDYKSATEVVTRTDMSPEAREMTTWLLGEVWDLFVTALGEDRGLSEDTIVRLMEHAEFTAEEAREEHLVDDLLYWDELEARLKRPKDDELRVVSQEEYAGVEPAKLGLKGKKTIAVVHAQGTIGGRKSRVDPLLGVMMGHESVVSDLERARTDKNVAAVVFRVDSSGGESLTSDLIGHEVQVTAREKPVVVSMVDVAASGGYLVSYRATKLVADPMTLTGSIGSISGKFNLKGFYDKLGITHDTVEKGPMGLLWWSGRDFTDEERARFEENHWAGFNQWLADVAEHRGMTFAEAEALAHGRVWSGRQAKANGLVDELGGLDRAIEVAKELAGIPASDKVTLVHYPEPQGFLEMVLGGEGNLTAAVQCVFYRWVREDLAETWHMLTRGSLDRMDPVSIP